jgi:molecular chaperone DnaJ
MARNYYLILGVGQRATQDEIRHAYRLKAQAMHPDHYGADAGPFREIQEAYETLSDPEQRRMYDRSQASRPPQRAGKRPTRVPGRRPPVEPLDEVVTAASPDISLARSFQTFTPSFEEIFDRLLGNFTGWSRPKSEGPESLTLEVPIAYEDAVGGGTVRVLVPAITSCPACGGHGGLGLFECPRCGGAGQVTGEFPVRVPFPAGTPDGYTVGVSLDRLGIRNLYLMVRFSVV